MSFVKDPNVRVRIAPSPTGDPHVGTAYVALFNYAFAKRHGGTFVLRIEDTDQTRYKASSEEKIMTSLKWLGLSWDEGPDVGGPYGPYRQSERQDLHRQHAQKLVEAGQAYPCFCTPDRLDAMRKQQQASGQNTGYDRHCRGLSAADVAAKLAAKTPHVIRLRMPIGGVTIVKDLVRGDVEFDNARIDDQVLLKSDGFPTYHLANVVDDHLMKITHVVRAEEWISSTPKHVVLYRAFGWKEPVFCHLPLLRNTDRSKISKRKNPTSLSYYERAGILPEALLNFLGLMGWSFGGDVEQFSLAEMVDRFDLKDVNLGGPIFAQEKLQWLNNKYLQKMGPDRFAAYIQSKMFSTELLKALAPFVLERIDRLDQFVDKNAFFFNGALDYTGVPLIPAGKTPDDVAGMVSELAEVLDEVYDWAVDPIKAALEGHRAKINWKPKDYFMTVRLIMTGRKDSPPLNESIMFVGREMARFRLRHSLDAIRRAAPA